MHIAIRNIIRNKTKSFITVIICFLLVAAFNVYFGNMESNKEQLYSLPERIPVYCQITNPNGSRSTGISIDERIAVGLLNSSHIKDAVYGVRLIGGIGEFSLEEWEQNLTLCVEAVNSLEGVPGLTQENIQLDMDAGDFFHSSEPICIVRSSLMEKNNWKTGQEIPLNLWYYDYDDIEGIHGIPLEILDIKIMGTMEYLSTETGQMPPDILLPIGLADTIYRRQEIPLQMSFFSFYVADPLKINAFKKEMKSLGLVEKNGMGRDSYQGSALTVQDTVFISLAEKLQETINIFESFFVIICIMVLSVGYIVSILLMASREKEFALMRAQGARGMQCIKILWLEQFFLALTGIITGDIVCLMFQSINIILVTDAVIAAGYMSGCTLALLRMGKINTMQLLFKTE